MRKINSVVGPVAGILLSGCASVADQRVDASAGAYDEWLVELREREAPEDCADLYPEEQFTLETCQRVNYTHNRILEAVNPESPGFIPLLEHSFTGASRQCNEDILARCTEIHGADAVTNY